MRLSVLVVCLSLTLAACAEEGSDEPAAPEQRVGKPAQCQERLGAKMDPAYLRQGGIASLTALDKELQIAKTCREVPSDFPVDDAAYLARSEIVDQLRAD